MQRSTEVTLQLLRAENVRKKETLMKLFEGILIFAGGYLDDQDLHTV